MIRNFTVLCKLNFINSSEIKLFNDSIRSFSIESAVCCSCGAKQACRCHDSYERDMIVLEEGSVRCYTVTIPRIKCSSCNRTHAVLPDILVPYSSYSLLFILTVLRDFFSGSKARTEICALYGISISTLYQWKSLFLTHKALHLGILSDMNTSALAFLDFTGSPVRRFAFLPPFFDKFAFSFLQNAHSRIP